MTRCSAPRNWHECGKVGRGLMAAAMVASGACDLVPTEPPRFETRFVVPGENTTLTVSQLLPSSIAVVGSNFRLTLGAQAIPARTLGQMCGSPCLALQGQTVPKPAFSDSVQTTIPMPADVSRAAISAGTVTVALSHNFGFDPLRPPGAATVGSLVLTVRNGTRVLGTTTITDPFPSNTTITRTVALAPGDVSGPLVVTTALNSPAGGTAPANWVVVNNNAQLSGTVTPNAIDIGSAGVLVNNKSVSVQSVAIDLTGFEDFTDRVKSGALVVNMTNPLGIAGIMVLTLTGGSAGAITKQVTVASGTTSQRIQFTEAELESLLGNNIQLTITGPVSGTAAGNIVTVTPSQQITIATQLDLIFELGAGDN